MKKLLIVVAVLAIVAWVLSWFWNPTAVATSTARQWPGGLGPLDAAADKVPPLKTSAAAAKLMTLASALQNVDVVESYLKREVARGDLTIGAPPALPDVTAIRELLLREPITWERRVGVGDAKASNMRGAQMTSARVLIASALAKGRAQDRAAWADLEAAWKLARSLEPHTQQMMLQTAAMSIARMINAVAWKMPLPAPAWFSELQARDSVRPLLEAYQLQTASYAKDGWAMFPTKSLATSVEHDRLIAEELFKTTQCDVNTRMNDLGTDLTSVWRRAFRYRAEREATANALHVREGKPAQTASVCSDGTWTFDGTTLRFSREIATNPPEWSMPLALRVKAP
jgi:hypothetical protein